MYHTTGLPRISLRQKILEFWLDLFIMCDLQVQGSSYHLLIWSNQHNVINIVDQCNILWKRQMVKILLNYVMTQDWKINISLKQNCKGILLASPNFPNCFQWFSWTGTGNEAFARLLATCYVPGDVFICSSQGTISGTAVVVGVST